MNGHVHATTWQQWEMAAESLGVLWHHMLTLRQSKYKQQACSSATCMAGARTGFLRLPCGGIGTRQAHECTRSRCHLLALGVAGVCTCMPLSCSNTGGPPHGRARKRKPCKTVMDAAGAPCWYMVAPGHSVGCGKLAYNTTVGHWYTVGMQTDMREQPHGSSGTLQVHEQNNHVTVMSALSHSSPGAWHRCDQVCPCHLRAVLEHHRFSNC